MNEKKMEDTAHAPRAAALFLNKGEIINAKMATVQQMRILIEGRLHGMNFRYKTQEEAKKLGLTGFVRILADGRVEIEAQGEQPQLEELLKWCQSKPHNANIKNILYRFDEGQKNYSDFSVR